jgi:hypothetical protein
VIKSRTHFQKTEINVNNVHIKYAPTTVLTAETTFTLSTPASTVRTFQSSIQLT